MLARSPLLAHDESEENQSQGSGAQGSGEAAQART